MSEHRPAAVTPAGRQAVRLRVILCTCGGLFGAHVLRQLRSCDQIELAAVIRSTRVLDARFGFIRGAAAQIRHSGLRYALYLWCATTLADWLCALAGSAVPARSTRGGPAVHATRDINDAESHRFIAAHAPDLLISAFFNQRLHPATLALPRRGGINIHPSLLPAGKGVDPAFQSLLRGTPPLGVSVHVMTADLDAGHLLAQRRLDAPGSSSVFAATAALFREGAALLAGAVDAIRHGGGGIPQSGPGDYQSWPTREEVHRLRARGGALVRFSDLSGLLRTARAPAATHRPQSAHAPLSAASLPPAD